jgi:hypothetical protein
LRQEERGDPAGKAFVQQARTRKEGREEEEEDKRQK